MHINDIRDLPNLEAVQTRFLKWVNKSGDCWIWTGNKDRHGYGRFRIDASYMPLSHRVSYVLFKSAIFDDKHVCHECDNPSCVRPSHLFLGTPKDNMADRERKGRGRQPRGNANGKAIITEDQARAIRDDPRSQHQIARAFGVSRGCVSSIKGGKTWRHI